MLVFEKADERGKEGEVTKLFVVPGAVENHSSQHWEALFHFTSVSAQRYDVS